MQHEEVNNTALYGHLTIPSSWQHCAGVESVALSDDGETVFTASRDATVRSWHVRGEWDGPPSGRWKATYEGHSNWVNDVVTLGDRLVTCSSDHCVSLWDARPSAEGGETPWADCCYESDMLSSSS